ncbi:MFS transporter [Liquorilactobacillus mali]|uniref:MFS transporter n=1 Tax=Liquorilactobacillus mali TaxID=1618 RepID=UPI002954B930|nr:MFS transporter [Liquorilactobacillus mali]
MENINQTILLQKRMDRAKESPLFYRVFALATAGLVLDASDIYLASATNTVITATKFATISQSSEFLSAGFLGLFLGSILAGFLGDALGRNKIYSINLLVFGFFTFMAGFAPNIAILTYLRFGASLGLGAEIVTGFALINEFAPVLHRGRWAGGASVIGNLGSPLGLLFCTLLIPQFGWRSVYFVIGSLALILWLVRLHNFPESPRWLLTKGRQQEAATLIGNMEVNGTYSTEEHQQTGKVVVTSLKRGLFVGIIAAAVTTVAQYTFTSWVPTLLVKQGVDLPHSLWFSTVMMLGAPVGAVLGTLLVERAGRRKTIVTGFLLTAIFGIIYAYQTSSIMAMLIGFLLTVCLYAMNASILSVYVPELFQTKFRFRGEGLAAGTGKMLTILMPFAVVWTLTELSSAFIFYGMAAITVLGALIVGIFGPETKQHPVE